MAAMPRSPVLSVVGDMPGESSLSPTANALDQKLKGAPAGYRRLIFRLSGAAPLLMHNARLSDPLNPLAKMLRRVTSKRAKTEADHEEMARIEFLGSLYVDKGEPCIPGEVLEACLTEAAKKMRRGNQAKAGIICLGNFPLEYDGPRKPDDLWANEQFRLTVGVKIQRNRVMRTRPIFRDWACEVSVDFRPGDLNQADVEEMVRVAGDVVGIGDWRPKFGRFTADLR